MCNFYVKDGCVGGGVKMGSWKVGEHGVSSRLKDVVPKVEAVRSMKCVVVPARPGLEMWEGYRVFMDGSVVGNWELVPCKKNSCDS